MTHPDEEQHVQHRHQDTARNLILNRTSSDLEDIIWGHDPEVDTSINNGVWDRLDKMALEIEEGQAARIAELEAQVSSADGDLVTAAIYGMSLSDQEAQTAKVKPLVWEYPEHHKDCEIAETIFGKYNVWDCDGEGYLSKPEERNGFHCGVGIASAKKRAQADYDRRILSALEPAPVSAQQAAERLIAEINRPATLEDKPDWRFLSRLDMPALRALAAPDKEAE